MQHKILKFFMAAAVLGALGLGANANSAKASSSQQITVTTTKAIRSKAEHVATGGLYGLENQTTPSAKILAPLHPKTFTQPPVNAGQLPNGLPVPGGDFDKVAPTAEKIGAKIIIRLPDLSPTFPYGFTTMDNWLAQVKTMVTEAKKQEGAIYGYELWNEPNWTYEGQKGRTEQDYFQLWDATYKEVRQLDPNAKIVGPSESGWNEQWMDAFFAHVTAAHTMPDVICWHLLGGGPDWVPSGFNENVKEMHEIEAKYGIPQDTKIVINEYTAQQETAVPGDCIRYIQAFENVPQVDGADLAFWYNYGRMDNLLTDKQQPNGGYQLYKWYGSMTGQMDKTSTPNSDNQLASVANTTYNKAKTTVVFGGGNGNVNLKVTGLSSAKFGKNASVQVNTAPWYGVDTPVNQSKVESGTVPVKKGTVNVLVKNMQPSSGYQLIVTPSKSKAKKAKITYAKKSVKAPIRVEAENGKLSSSALEVKQGSYASANMFVRGFKDSSEFDTLTFKAAKAGKYQLQFGYGNGASATQAQLTLNKKKLANLNLPNTTGLIDAIPNVHGTRKIVQFGKVTLKKGTNTLKVAGTNGPFDFDYVQFTPVK